MNFLNKIVCKHKYIKSGERLVETGMSKIIYYKCEVCGKTKIEKI